MNNNFFQAVQQLQQMKNPKQAVMNMLENNQTTQQLKGISNGRSMEQTVRQLAKQQGISEEQLMQAYNSLANKR